MTKFSKKTLMILVFQALALLASGAAHSQDAKERMFRQATAAFELAKNKDARRLAPDTYARAVRSYKNAEKKFSQGRTVSSVQKDLVKATIDFEKAQLVADLASQKMGTNWALSKLPPAVCRHVISGIKFNIMSLSLAQSAMSVD